MRIYEEEHLREILDDNIDIFRLGCGIGEKSNPEPLIKNLNG